MIAAVSLVVTIVWIFLSKKEDAKVASVVLTSQGCIAAAELGIATQSIPENTCLISIPGMHKYGDKL